MFRFLEETFGKKGAFLEKTTAMGIIIPATTSTQKVARWGEVVAVGPDAEAAGLKVGDYILIEPLMWMEGVKVDDKKVWKTDDSKVLAVTNDIEACQSQAF
jgi:co-chaperonin GroES (HSP10)